MDILQVVQSFRTIKCQSLRVGTAEPELDATPKRVALHGNLSNSNKLTITIGKSISRQCFSISNKIFFDIFKTYLSKNGWYISKQTLSKRFYYNNKYLDTTIGHGSSTVLGLDVPLKQTVTLIEKSGEVVKKYRGTYFDIFCQQYQEVELENVEEFSESCEHIYNEVTSEISVFKKSGTNIEVILSVCKEGTSPVFIVQLCLESLDKEGMESIMELIELAMSKYKKTERTVSSIFTQM